MASIKGLELKNVKNPVGKEGYGLVTSLYLNGKKVGTYEDYGNGEAGKTTFTNAASEEAVTKIVFEHAKEYQEQLIYDLYSMNPGKFEADCESFIKQHPYINADEITPMILSGCNIEYIINDILALKEDERIYKKYIKKGYRAISVGESGITLYPEEYTDEQIQSMAEEKGDEKVYLSPDYFNQ